MASGDEDIYRMQIRQNTPLNVALCAIWYRLWQLTGFSSSGSGGIAVTVSNPIVGSTSLKVTAGQSGTIPAGSKGWTFTILTGTATFNGATSLPAGFSESDENTTAAAISYSFDTPGTGYVRWNT